MDPLLAEVKLFAGNFPPRGWAFCDGQLLPISQNAALFSLLGTMYGGDGRTTFGLPDLRGRTPIGPRQGAGLTPYREGQFGGQEHVTLTNSQMPSHSHNLNADVNPGTTNVPTNHILANTAAFDNEYSTATPNTSLNSQAIGTSGGNQSHENRQPFLAINYIIATQGVFPSRS
ncbi:MAG: phage tail protein [Aureispira sp.]